MNLPATFREPEVTVKARKYGSLLRRYMLPQLPWVITLGILLFTSLGLQLVPAPDHPLLYRRGPEGKPPRTAHRRGRPLHRHHHAPADRAGLRHLLLRARRLDRHEQHPRGPRRARPLAGHGVPQRAHPRRDDRARGRRPQRAWHLLLPLHLRDARQPHPADRHPRAPAP